METASGTEMIKTRSKKIVKLENEEREAQNSSEKAAKSKGKHRKSDICFCYNILP